MITSNHKASGDSSRCGMTLTEMLVATTMTLVIMGVVVQRLHLTPFVAVICPIRQNPSSFHLKDIPHVLGYDLK